MTQQENKLSKGIIEVVVAEVINKDDSPYKQMIGKVGSIGVDYFEHIERGNVLAEELNMNLKEKVVSQFGQMYDKLLTETGVVEKVMENVMAQARKATTETEKSATSKELMRVANNLKIYASNRLLFIPKVPYQESDLKEKFERAKRITLMEHIIQNNDKDVVDFYRALICCTEWECKNLIERQTSQLLRTIAEKIEQIL